MSTTIDIQNSDSENNDLHFQEFPLNNSKVPVEDDFPEEHEELLKEENKPKPSVLEFSFYQSFWDVNTSQVLQRIFWSMVPTSGRNTFLNQHIKNNPDLYGPFWICISLVFSIAISSNIADYLSSEGKANHIWHYDFHKVTIAAATIFSYIFLLPIVLWMLLKYNTIRGVRFTLLEILCVYGYSIFIYIPISILWVIQIPFLQWSLVVIGALLSGVNLVRNFWPALRHTNIKGYDSKQMGIIVLCLILLFHSLLAASFVLYFFKPNQPADSSTPVPFNDEIINPSKVPLSVLPSSLEEAIRDTEAPIKINLPNSLPQEMTDENPKLLPISLADPTKTQDKPKSTKVEGTVTNQTLPSSVNDTEPKKQPVQSIVPPSQTNSSI